MDQIQELSRRLEIVEARYRRMRTIVILCFIAASAVMLMGQGRQRTPAARNWAVPKNNHNPATKPKCRSRELRSRRCQGK